jgi:putative phosphoesterase
MKVAVLADIHANAHALNAIVSEPDFREVEHVFVLGDIIGYYYWPAETVTQLKCYSTTMVSGNHEGLLSQSANNPEAAVRVENAYGSGINLALQSLPQTSQREICNAPSTVTVEVGGVNCLLCHGSPWHRDEYVYPDAPPEVLVRCASSKVDFVFMGHTHYPLMFSYRGTVVSNPGSVGQARDRGGQASWQILDTRNQVIVQKRTPYDVTPVVAAALERDPEIPYLSDVLRRPIR